WRVRRSGLLSGLVIFSLVRAGQVSTATAAVPVQASVEGGRVDVIPATPPAAGTRAAVPTVPKLGSGVEAPDGLFDPVTPITVPNMSFQYNGVPGVGRTRLISPADRASNVGTTPTLKGGTLGEKPYGDVEWFYTVCHVRSSSMSQDSCGESAVIAKSGWITASSWKVPSGKLEADRNYKWMVSVRINGYSMYDFGADQYWFATGDPVAAPLAGDAE